MDKDELYNTFDLVTQFFSFLEKLSAPEILPRYYDYFIEDGQGKVKASKWSTGQTWLDVHYNCSQVCISYKDGKWIWTGASTVDKIYSWSIDPICRLILSFLYNAKQGSDSYLDVHVPNTFTIIDMIYDFVTSLPRFEPNSPYHSHNMYMDQCLIQVEKHHGVFTRSTASIWVIHVIYNDSKFNLVWEDGVWRVWKAFTVCLYRKHAEHIFSNVRQYLLKTQDVSPVTHIVELIEKKSEKRENIALTRKKRKISKK